MDVKKCAVCGREKPLSAYTKRSGSVSRRGTCRACTRKRQRESARGEAGRETAANEGAAAPDRAERGEASVEAAQARQSEAAQGPAARGAAFGIAAAIESEAAQPADETEPQRKRKRRRRSRRKAGKHELTGSAPGQSWEASVHTSEQAALTEAKTQIRSSKRSTGQAPEGFEGEALPVQASAAVNVWSAQSASSAAGDLYLQGVSGADGGSSEHVPSGTDSKPKRKRKRHRRKRRNGRVKAHIYIHQPPDDQPQVRPPDKRIVPFKGPFTYDTSILNDRGTGLIRLRGRRETSKRWSTEIPLEMAVRMVEEGAAGIINPGVIHKLYSKTDFRLLVLQRDNYICHYCGRFGDTIDHVLPKSKGGLSSPFNCVCACADCNLKKADSLDFVYDDF